MNNNFLRNREGKIIGGYDGTWLRDGTDKIVAVYYPSENITRDRTGRTAGKGDQRLRALGESGDK